MKLHLKKLNPFGFAHHFVMMLVIVGVAVGGTGYLVLTHAQTPYKNSYSCPSHPVLKAGTAGTQPDCTKYLQYVLQHTVPSSDLALNGIYDAGTLHAVQRYQYTAHVPNSGCKTGGGAGTCDGVVGASTWASVDATNTAQTKASQPSAAVTPSASSTPAATPTSPAPTTQAPVTTKVPAKTPTVETTKPAGNEATPTPTGRITCGTETDSSITINVTYSNSAAISSLYRETTLLKNYPQGARTLTYTDSSLPSHTDYVYSLKTGDTILFRVRCGTQATFTKNPTPPSTNTAVPTAPTVTNGDCVAANGANYFYNGTRCVTLIPPTCPTGSTLVPSGVALNKTYYCQVTNPVASTAKPASMVDCLKTTDGTYIFDGTRCVTRNRPTCPVTTALVTNDVTPITYYCKTLPVAKPVATSSASTIVHCTILDAKNHKITKNITSKQCTDTHIKQNTDGNANKYVQCKVLDHNGNVITEKHTEIYCARTQKEEHITAAGVHLVNCSYTNPAGSVVKLGYINPTVCTNKKKANDTAVAKHNQQVAASNQPTTSSPSTSGNNDRITCVYYLDERDGHSTRGVMSTNACKAKHGVVQATNAKVAYCRYYNRSNQGTVDTRIDSSFTSTKCTSSPLSGTVVYK